MKGEEGRGGEGRRRIFQCHLLLLGLGWGVAVDGGGLGAVAIKLASS
jgi:hypothetical protein